MEEDDMKLNNFIRFVMVLTLVFSSASAIGKGKNPHAKSLFGSFNGEVTFPLTDDCLDLTGAPVQTVSETEGKMTHMGKTSLLTAHCPTSEGDALGGRAVFIAANGDEVWGEYFAITVQPPPPVIVQEITMVIDGGTGRFEDASGMLEGMVYINPQEPGVPGWPLKFVLAGWVIY